jgi:hypothetical protein
MSYPVHESVVGLCGVVLIAASLAGCRAAGAHGRDAGVPADASPDVGERTIGALDLLFVIDNSGGTIQMQEQMVRAFPTLSGQLVRADQPLDLHLGIVTSDLGAGPFQLGFCPRIGGDQGMLHNSEVGTSCGAADTPGRLMNPDDRFLRLRIEVGQEPAANFTGTLADAFACYARRGNEGCGFEHQLAAMRAALAGCGTEGGCDQPVNEGFLRRDALLAVVILTDEDDCSAPADTALFDPSQLTLDSPLGPLTSYRCFQFGNLCDGHDPGRAEGARSGCVPGSFDPDPLHQLLPVDDFVAFLRGLKPDPRWTFVAVVGSPPEPIVVTRDANGYPSLAIPCDSCYPALRLPVFVAGFDSDRSRYYSVCGQNDDMDYAPYMAELGAALAALLSP